MALIAQSLLSLLEGTPAVKWNSLVLAEREEATFPTVAKISRSVHSAGMATAADRRMQSAITVSLVPEARGGPFVFWDDLEETCAHAAALGFDAVEIFPPSAQAIRPHELQRILARHKLRVAAIGTGAGWVLHRLSLTHPDDASRARAVEFVREIITLAAGFGAPAIIGSIQGRCEQGISRGQSLAWLGEALTELGGHAAGQGQTLLLEPLNRYETNLVNRLSDGAELLRELATPHVRLLADLFHLNIEEPSVPRAIHAAGAYLGHVHFSDSNRQAMGFGHTDAAAIIAALRDIDFTGYLSGEILPLPDGVTAAKQTIAMIRKYTT